MHRLPTHVQGVNLADAGALTLLPYIVAASFANGGAAVADRLMLARWRWTVTRTRKAINMTAQVGPCLALLVLAMTTRSSESGRGAVGSTNASRASAADDAAGAVLHASATPSPGPLVSTLLCGAAIALGALTQAGCWSNMMDVAPRHVSVLLGLANTFATFPGVICNLLTGWMLSAGWGWSAVFGLAACVEASGAITYYALASGDQQFW